MPASLHKWIRLSFFNLLIVAALGITMRYKIAFSLPFIVQKNLLEAHSHFAFSGWVTQILMTFIALFISKNNPAFSLKKYNYLLLANLVAAYGMLFSFPFAGYGAIAIIFSTLSIFVSYSFAIVVWKDLSSTAVNTITAYWLKAALFFNAFSSIGSYALAYMMTTKNLHETPYLVSIYFFLHFQYNGWFFFTCMGLFTDKIPAAVLSFKKQKIIFYLFAFACIPAFFLSALWLPIPVWLYTIVIAAAFAQAIGWGMFLMKIVPKISTIFKQIIPAARYLLCLSAFAATIKLLLQVGSIIPSVSTWAFGFRPIVIGYLHLVFLGIFSIFILAFALQNRYLTYTKKTAAGIWIFIAGIFLNEVFLMAQGVGAIKYYVVPYVNQWLLGAACIMFIGILIFIVDRQRINQNK